MIRDNKGFTLVELTLSMAFIGILLLSIAFLTLQISGIYNKGITLRDVNQVGQTVTSDIQRALNASSQQAVLYKTATNGGRLCIGTMVYAWNYGKDLGTNNSTFNVFADGHKADIRLVKFQSNGDEYCVDKPGLGYLGLPNALNELLSSGGRDLAVQQFTIDDPTVLDGEQTIYSLHLTLGTNTTEVINGDGCEQPKSAVDDQYCAVNQFNFIARAGNKAK